MSPVFIFLISMSILKWSNVPCRILGDVHVMSVIFFLLSIRSISHVDLKKWLFRPVELIIFVLVNNHIRVSPSLPVIYIVSDIKCNVQIISIQ